MTIRVNRRAVLIGTAVTLIARPGAAHAAAADDVAALNKVLETDHAAIYDLAAAGATLPLAVRATVLRHYDEHRARRDALEQRIRALGGSPAAALPAYADPVAGADPTADIVRVEQACVQAYRAAVAVVTDPTARQLCARAFIDEARHLALARSAAGLAGAPTAFVTGE